MLASLPWIDRSGSAEQRAWRFSFDRDTPALDGACRIPLPNGAVAEGSAVGLEDVFDASHAGDGSILIIGTTTGGTTPYAVRQDVERWVQAASDGGWPALDLNLRARVMRGGDRIAIFGTPEQVDEALPAVVVLSWMTARTSRLENEIRAAWASVAEDSGLTHSVGPAEAKRQVHVDAMTRCGWRFRVEHLDLTRHLRLPGALAAGELRLFREMALQSGLSERLDALEDPIECIQDLYESANDRLSEFRYFRREYALEFLILLVLMAELVLLGFERVF